MEESQEILDNLVRMTRELGRSERDFVILGDGNSSAWLNKDSFYVKASGAQMENIQSSQFVLLRTAQVMQMLEQDEMSDLEIASVLSDAKLDASQPQPSIESVLHALALDLCGARYVGHTHPTAWVGILSSQYAKQAVSGRIFTEHVNICGPAALFIPYLDPGLPLALAVKERMVAHMRDYNEPPREILLQNHGLFALGNSPQEVINITAMSVRAAHALRIAYSLGGPRFLSQKDIDRIRSRLDEKYRRDLSNTPG